MVEVKHFSSEQVNAIYGKFIDGLPLDERYSYSIQDPVFWYWFRRQFGTELIIEYQSFTCRCSVELDDLEFVELLLKI